MNSRRRPFDAEFRQAFEDRWDRFHTYLCRLTGDQDQASDIAQECFVRLYRRGSMPDDLGAWLASVAHNLLRDTGRRRQVRRRILAQRRERVPRADPAVPPDERLEQRERTERVREALDSLPGRQAQVLLLRAGGMSYKEIAVAMDMPMGSVGQTLARALEAFRRTLTEGQHAPYGR